MVFRPNRDQNLGRLSAVDGRLPHTFQQVQLYHAKQADSELNPSQKKGEPRFSLAVQDSQKREDFSTLLKVASDDCR